MARTCCLHSSAASQTRFTVLSRPGRTATPVWFDKHVLEPEVVNITEPRVGGASGPNTSALVRDLADPSTHQGNLKVAL